MILLANEKKMSELYDSVDYNSLEFEFVGSTKNISFYEYIDPKERFHKTKNNWIRFSEAKEK